MLTCEGANIEIRPLRDFFRRNGPLIYNVYIISATHLFCQSKLSVFRFKKVIVI